MAGQCTPVGLSASKAPSPTSLDPSHRPVSSRMLSASTSSASPSARDPGSFDSCHAAAACWARHAAAVRRLSCTEILSRPLSQQQSAVMLYTQRSLISHAQVDGATVDRSCIGSQQGRAALKVGGHASEGAHCLELSNLDIFGQIIRAWKGTALISVTAPAHFAQTVEQSNLGRELRAQIEVVHNLVRGQACKIDVC